MYLFKVECEFTAKEYNPEVMSEPKYFRAYRTSEGVPIAEQDKVGIWASYEHVAQFTELLYSKGYYDICVRNAVWERVY